MWVGLSQSDTLEYLIVHVRNNIELDPSNMSFDVKKKHLWSQKFMVTLLKAVSFSLESSISCLLDQLLLKISSVTSTISQLLSFA